MCNFNIMKLLDTMQNALFELTDFLIALPLWIDLTLLSLAMIGFYFLFHTLIPILLNFLIPFVHAFVGAFKITLGQNHDYRALKQKYPRLFRFFHARLDTTRFSGLASTLFLSVIFYIVALFGGLVEDLITQDSIVRIDHSIAQWITAKRTDYFNHLFWALTQLGSFFMILFLTAFFTLFLWFSGMRYYLLGLYVSIVGSEIITFLGKYAFGRQRPENPLYYEPFMSFPSGHATIAVAFFGFVVYTFLRETRQIRSQINLLFTAATLIFLIGSSRIYLGVHYLSDILAGYLVGAMWMVVGIALSEYQKSRSRALAMDTRESHRLAITIAAGAFVCYVLYLSWHPFTSIV